jgi:hypothetical protein
VSGGASVLVMLPLLPGPRGRGNQDADMGLRGRVPEASVLLALTPPEC